MRVPDSTTFLADVATNVSSALQRAKASTICRPDDLKVVESELDKAIKILQKTKQVIEASRELWQLA